LETFCLEEYLQEQVEKSRENSDLSILNEPTLGSFLGNDFHKRVLEYEKQHGFVRSLETLKEFI
jgi:hypothetical protein